LDEEVTWPHTKEKLWEAVLQGRRNEKKAREGGKGQTEMAYYTNQG